MSPRAVAKLIAPRTKDIVRRGRVLTAIERALRSGSCWVAAPAGYGKTTALADFLRRKPTPHVWYRVDEGDQDIASFFHYMAQSLRGARAAPRLPVFGPEYADQPREFARRFFRAYFAKLPLDALLVLDDLHHADVPQFREILAILLGELPDNLRCVCVSRTLPPPQVAELRFKGRLTLVDQATLEFSDREARALIATRVKRRTARVDASPAHGWAAGLVLLAERAAASNIQPDTDSPGEGREQNALVFAALAKQMFEALPPGEQLTLLQLSVLPEITPDLACRLTGSRGAGALLERLHQRQLLVTRGDATHTVFKLHDLLRDFLRNRLVEQLSARDIARLRESAAGLLNESGQPDDAIDLAIQSSAWSLARRLIVVRAERLLAEGRRATLIDWCERLPPAEFDGWLSYWLGVANMADDATAETWLARAWSQFAEQGELGGQCLTAARAVLSKTDSWRTHEGLAAWTQRVLELIDHDFPLLRSDDQLLAWSGMLRAVDFAPDYHSENPGARRLTLRLLERLAKRAPGDSPTLRLVASFTLIEHAGSSGQAEIFERAVDSVCDDLRNDQVSPWVRGLWLVAFGSVSGRYFPYAKRGFPYASAEAALREAIALGQREGLRGVEFGALYHLQLLMKMRNDFSEFAALIARIAQVADSRHTTQVAVVADCQAALHTMQGRFIDAYAACERFMAAIEAANEPPIERWPHFITKFQVLLADHKPREAMTLLEDVLHLFDGGVRRRTVACIGAARVLDAKWRSSPEYLQQLREWVRQLQEANWSSILLNLPELAAELCADALEEGIQPAFCRDLIRRRALTAPSSRPASWPWALRIHVLGEFRLQSDELPLNVGPRAAPRSLDILRVLATAKEHACALEDLHEWLWSDADGDQAKAACEQALHRLRKLLGRSELLVLRDGKLRLAPEHVWIDLDAWEGRVRQAAQGAREAASSTDGALERAFSEFGGPLLRSERVAAWSLHAAERVRSKYLDLTRRIGRQYESAGNIASARSTYLRALDFYPTAEPCYEGLIRTRVAQGDTAGALEDFRRYQRVLDTTLQTVPSPAIRALIGPLLASSTLARPV